MLVNADFSAVVTVRPDGRNWVSSPQQGVERVMLDRVGGEVARATSLVRYKHDSYFPSHRHPGGEEIFVLSGTFSDESGDFPAGWYLRNPPNSSHRPHSKPGAVILVKLHQMQKSDDRTVRINSLDPSNWHTSFGREYCPLFESDSEQAWLEALTNGQQLAALGSGGLEVFVLSGALFIGDVRYPEGSWMRLPDNKSLLITADGASKIFVKSGHLPGAKDLEALSA